MSTSVYVPPVQLHMRLVRRPTDQEESFQGCHGSVVGYTVKKLVDLIREHFHITIVFLVIASPLRAPLLDDDIPVMFLTLDHQLRGSARLRSATLLA